jgi:type I restriction enzyme S subunit
MEDICEVTSSKRIYATELTPAGVPFLKSKEIIEKVNGQAHGNLLYISEQRFQQITEQAGSIEAGDVLLTSRGTLGVPYVVIATDRFHFADGNLTWFRRFKGLDSRYLNYFFLSPLGKAALQKCVIGSSQQAYTIAALKKAEVPLPPVAIQRRIAGILSAYDELIENSQRRIRILEAMARTLYREWFVNFRFPGHKTVPRVLSSLGEIPQGWEVRNVADFADFTRGFEPGSKAYAKEPGSGRVRFLRVGDLSKRDSGLYIAERLAEGRFLQPLDIALTLDGSVGEVRLGLDGAYSSGIRRVDVKDKSRLGWVFAYQLLLSDASQATIQAHAKGTTIKHAGSAVGALIFVSPPRPLIERFEAYAAPMIHEVLVLQQKVENLRRTRDLLLPRLLSGQIDVEAMPV